MIKMWRPVKDWEGKYEVSNTGKVRSLLNCRLNPRLEPEIIKTYKTKGGYLQVTLWEHKKCVHKLVHRLVAEAWKPNPNNYPVINHLDCNPANNVVDNLEWTTQQDNCNYGDRNKKIVETRKQIGSSNMPKGIEGIRISDGFKVEFDSISEAGRYFGGKSKATSINNCLKGWSKSALGFFWNYK